LEVVVSSEVFEEVSQRLSKPIGTLCDFFVLAEKAMRAMLPESYELGDKSCFPHLFLLSSQDKLTYIRLELGPEADYHDRMSNAIIRLARERRSYFYAFVQEYALSSTIMDRNGLLIQAGDLTLDVQDQRILVKTYWVLGDGELQVADLAVCEFNELVRRHKRTPIRR
jgi:hypothetical protein